MKIFNYICLSLIVFWPVAFYIFEHIDTDRGLIWFYLQQLYYWPIGSWLKEPFFRPDSEIGFFVKPLGRIITACIYLLIFLGSVTLKNFFAKSVNNR